MAKWGEGDPRWIVEQRSDGKNVNNWHWTEKNATEYSKNKLKELLVDLEISDPAAGSVKITEITTFNGEASASNRKGKLIFFYELDLKLKWSGKTSEDKSVNGSIAIPNLSEENSIDEVDVTVTMSSEANPERNKTLAMVKKEAPKAIRKQLSAWLKDFKEEYSRDIVLPTNVKIAQTERSPVLLTPSGSPAPAAAAASAASASASSSSSQSTAAKKGVPVTTVEINDEFHCSPEDLFQAMLSQERVSTFTRSETKIDPKINGEFSLFSGNVSGFFKEITPFERIVQAWRFNSWPEGHFSEVTITLTPKGSETALRLVQTNVPVTDAERTRSGWNDQYLQRMKIILGFGSGISMGF